MLSIEFHLLQTARKSSLKHIIDVCYIDHQGLLRVLPLTEGGLA